MRIKIVASPAPLAREAHAEVCGRYKCVEDIKDADVLVVLGGDGTMLHAIHTYMEYGLPIYGMNRGHVGFLLNEYDPNHLDEKLEAAVDTIVHPLRTRIQTTGGIWDPLAINDVSITRQSGQAAKLKISVAGQVRIEELIGDGLIVSTPVGSTAYNRSAGGPILPLEAPLLAVTPICAFRPRHWKGAIIPDNLQVDVEVLERESRGVMVAADSFEVKDVISVSVAPDHSKKVHILSDPGRSWSDKLLSEQFYG